MNELHWCIGEYPPGSSGNEYPWFKFEPVEQRGNKLAVVERFSLSRNFAITQLRSDEPLTSQKSKSPKVNK